MSRFGGLGYAIRMGIFLALASSTVAANEKGIDRVLQEYNRSDSPGCSVGVFQHGQLAFAKGYGLASLELGVPNNPQTVFYIGSTSKQFVAASIVLAAQQGHLSLDDDIRKYLPEIPSYGETITIRHLVHHTSGLRDYLELMFLGGYPFENIYTDEWIVELIARQKALNFQPGEQHLYSNTGYFLLAQIVERATGQTLRRFADENIFKPLGMVHTHFHDDRNHVVEDRAMAYSVGEDGDYSLDWYTNFDKVGSGGLLTTVEDLLLWDRVFYGTAFGGEAFVDQMLERGKLDNGQVLDYAFALAHGEYRGLPTIEHSGGFMGFRAQLLRFPEQHLSVASLCNLASADPSLISQDVAALFLANQMAPDEVDSTADAPVAALERSPTELERIAGLYWSPDNRFTREIRVDDGKLMYVRSPENKTELAPLANGAYRMIDVPVLVEVRFEPTDTAPTTRMVVTVAGDDSTTLERIDPWHPSANELRPFAGTYYNDELDTEYTVEVEDDGLLVQADAPNETALVPVIQGLFTTTDGGSFRFEWTAEGAVETFTIDAGRARGLKFVKR